MAEGGGEQNNDENPFSFKIYVQRGTKASSDGDSGFLDHTPCDLVSDTRSRAKKEELQDRDSDSSSHSIKSSEAENPFSFTRFLQNSQKKLHSESHPSLPTFDLANDLPDFSSDTNGLQDTAEDPVINFSSVGEPSKLQSHHGDLDSSASDEFDAEDETFNSGPVSLTGLPDFLSDPALTVRLKDEDSDLGYSDNFEELIRLRQENASLRHALAEAREKAERDAARVKHIQEEMETQKRKDAEETKALEEMMQQVEKNLDATTKRAIRAEATITKLKKEIAHLQLRNGIFQSQGPSKDAEGSPSNGSNPSANTIIKDKVMYASEQLSAAAKNAEINLKELMKGVENLRLMSDILASVDKISDANSSPS